MRRALAVIIPFATAAVAFASASACGRARVAEPDYGEHPPQASEAACIPFPPPAAKPEEPGEPPPGKAVWIDGEWLWRSRGGQPGSVAGKWEWKPGGWVDPPADGKYARAALVRMPNGALAYYPPHWHLPDHYKRPKIGDAAAPVASNGVLLDCPDPPKHEITGAPKPLTDAGPEVHVGPAAVYGSETGSSSAPPVIVVDAIVPTDAKAPPMLIAPPP